MDTQLISDLFMIFNVSGDGSMSKQEFVFCWNGWIKKVFLISLFTIIRILTVKCVRVLVSGLLITYWLLLVVDGYLCVMLHKCVNFYPGLGIIYFHFNVKGCQFIDRVTSIVITRVFVSATICQLDKAVLSDWKLRRKKCEKLVQVDPLQDSEAQSFTQQKAKKNHISKVVSQHIINSSPNDKTCFWQRLCYCEGRSQFIN